ncbi:LexA family protein [Fodinibius salsisoli]|uniref:Translesion error-prone DNA polymerase V autoproteolytic subunit n=1 Tax=Fodinibius salsisoli TaxID=2820877 RepID=A0ABT3PPT5_9BACT|nr:translesion error-prone DNA polymerase V autoproteolytic subunit [Fodinibius salsisoli]MCW9707850.1 translesion error-prone DNA polymerase V autoproteolytic subunit [Fodinibius salsisoli]
MEDFSITDIYSGNVDRTPKQDANRFRKETGFPSPARDHFEKPLSLDEYIIKRPAATFFVRVKGDGLNKIGIFSDDILVVDRSISASPGHVIVAILEGEMVARNLVKQGKDIYLSQKKSLDGATKITDMLDFEVWGVVSHAIHKYI